MDDLKGGVLTLEHRYEVMEISAEDALAKRYRGRLEPFGLDVDIHVFDILARFGFPEAVASAIAVRLRRAARAASRLRGRHTVRVLDYGELRPTLSFWVMDTVTGPRLDRIIRSQGRLPLDGTARVIHEVSEALAEVHAFGLGHFAVRAEHVWFEQSPSGTYARLGGFGHTLLRHELTVLDASQVTGPIYVDHLAPETFQDADARAWLDAMGLKTPQTFDARWQDDPLPNSELEPSPVPGDPVAADVFALAVLAYRCLTGAHPYVADDERLWRDVITDLTDGPLIPPEEHGLELPAAVWRVLKSGLARDPGARPPDAISFARELNAAVQGTATQRSKNSSTMLEAVPMPYDQVPYEQGPTAWTPISSNSMRAIPESTASSFEATITREPHTEPHDNPRLRYLTAALVVLVVTNLVTLVLLSSIEKSTPLKLAAEPATSDWFELGEDPPRKLEPGPRELSPTKPAHYKIGSASSGVELRWEPDAGSLSVTVPDAQ